MVERIRSLLIRFSENEETVRRLITTGTGSNPSPLIRDGDACYGDKFVRRVRSLGIRDHPTSARSPWQNGYAERLIGSIRRECLDHIVVTGEGHLRHILKCYMEYYNAVRTHLSLGKDAPICRDIQCAGRGSDRAFSSHLRYRFQHGFRKPRRQLGGGPPTASPALCNKRQSALNGRALRRWFRLLCEFCASAALGMGHAHRHRLPHIPAGIAPAITQVARSILR
jgi:transposase InsO family protein